VSETRLGPFCVRTEPTQIAAYRNAIGASGDDVPAAFPICWLGQAEIRTAVEAACAGRLPLHECQTFDYARPLEVGTEYRLSLILHEQADPPRLAANAEITTVAGEICLRMETLLRLVVPAALELSA
jgi:hypothetical protein